MFHMVFSAEAEFETQPLVHYCINPSARPSAQCKRKICCCFFRKFWNQNCSLHDHCLPL